MKYRGRIVDDGEDHLLPVVPRNDYSDGNLHHLHHCKGLVLHYHHSMMTGGHYHLPGHTSKA